MTVKNKRLKLSRVLHKPRSFRDTQRSSLPDKSPRITFHRKSSRSLGLESLEPRTLLTAWIAQGPSPAFNGQIEGITNLPVVGAIHTVVAHPTVADTLWIGSVNGGIWRTNNSTAANPSWVPQTDNLPSLSISAMELDPTDATNNTLVAGIGRSSSFSGTGGDRTGIVRTTNGGTNWVNPGSTGLPGTNISGIAARGANIVVGVNTSDAFTCATVGVFRSTNSGGSFDKLTFATNGMPEGVVHDLVADPTTTGVNTTTLYAPVVFAGTCSGAPNGIYKSTNSGVTWSKVSNAAMDALILDTPTNNVEISARGNHVFADIIQNGRPAGIFYSATGGASWTAMDLARTPEGAPLPINTVSPGFPIVINTSPTQHGLNSGMEVKIAGVTGTTGANGVHTVNVLSSTSFSLNNTFDFTPWFGGGNWQKVVGLSPREKPGSQGGIHASIRQDPTTPTTVYIGGDRQDFPFPNFLGAGDFSARIFRGNALVAATGAVPSPQWKHLTHSNAVAAIPGGGTANGSAPHADSREIVFDANGNLIEVDDGGIYRRTSPQNNTGDWFSLNGNLQITEQHDIAYDTISNIIISGNQDTGTTQQQTTGGLVWTSVSTADGGDVAVSVSPTNPAHSVRYSSNQNLGTFRRRVYGPANNLISTTNLASIPDPQFVTPLAINAVDPNRLVIGGSSSVRESLNQGTSNTAVNGGSAVNSNALTYGHASDANLIVAGSGNSVLVRPTSVATNMAATPTPFPGGFVTDVLLDPSVAGTLFVLTKDSVWKTPNLGVTWTNITGNLPTLAGKFQQLEYVEGASDDGLVVATNHGVFFSKASGGFTTWAKLGTALPNGLAFDLDYDPGDDVLVVGTLGRGAWKLSNASDVITSGETSVVLNGSGNLVITDDNGGITNDALTISRNGANVRVRDPNSALDAGTGATQVDPNTVEVPLANITGNILVNSLGGSDTLTVSFAGGNPIPAGGLNFNGGLGAGDTLRVTGGAFTQITENFTTANNGNIQLVQAGPVTRTINYTGLAPVLLNVGSVSNLIFNLPAGPNVGVVVGDDLAAVANTSQIRGASFEDTAFTNPSTSLTVNLGNNGDSISLLSMDAAFAASTIVDGGTGADAITGNALANTLRGNGGNDNLNGGGGNDTLVGGPGNDTYFFDTDGALGTDTLNEAGGGTDTLNFSSTTTRSVAVNLANAAAQVVNAGLSLILSSATTIENIIGGSLGDTLTGNTLINAFTAAGGNDSLTGGGGNDSLIGGPGNDTYFFDADGALGTDTLNETGGGIDTLNFSSTTTRSVVVNLANAAAQVVNVGLSLVLGSATTFENVVGGSLADTFTGNTLANAFTAFGGNDSLTGGGGNDSLIGGPGNDNYVFDTDVALGTDTLNEAGGGIDRLIFSSTTTRSVAVNLGNAGAQVVNAGLSLILGSATTFENIVGGSLADTLTGNPLANNFTGGGGNDTLTGGSGNDTYVFDTDVALGTDTLNESGGGIDTLDFGLTTTRAVVINLTNAAAQVVNVGLSLVLGSGAAFEKVLGGGLGDTITGNAQNNILLGGGGADTIRGGLGRDLVIAGTGADIVFGESGDDLIIAGTTSHDTSEAALRIILAEWNDTTKSYLTRVNNLRAGVSGIKLKASGVGATVFNDGASDSLTGGPQADWFFASATDVITDLVAGELTDTLP